MYTYTHTHTSIHTKRCNATMSLILVKHTLAHHLSLTDRSNTHWRTKAEQSRDKEGLACAPAAGARCRSDRNGLPLGFFSGKYGVPIYDRACHHMYTCLFCMCMGAQLDAKYVCGGLHGPCAVSLSEHVASGSRSLREKILAQRRACERGGPVAHLTTKHDSACLYYLHVCATKFGTRTMYVQQSLALGLCMCNKVWH